MAEQAEPREDQSGWRKCRVLQGEPSWQKTCVQSVLDQAEALSLDAVVVSEDTLLSAKAIAHKKASSLLGSECDLLVYDLRSGIFPDALAAVVGTLRGGGELWLLAPDDDNWREIRGADVLRLLQYPLTPAQLHGHFAVRIQQKLADDGSVAWHTPKHPPPLLPVLPARTGEFVLNSEQRGIVDAVLSCARGHAKRPLVVTADRGRGKSTALGEALAVLAEGPAKQVVLLAVDRNALGALFDQLARSAMTVTWHSDKELRLGNLTLLYRHPDEQRVSPVDCDLLMIEEAAMLPLPLLQWLVEQHHRVVMSTTVHGYEGSGRGFVLRFLRLLQRIRPKHKIRHLQAPVRWASNDPLEALLNRLLVLDADISDVSADAEVASPDIVFEWMSGERLLADERLLRQWFGLLVAAHYQTRPSDLQQFLDAPGLQLLIARTEGQLLGAVVVAEEGCIDAAMCDAVCAGERRPRGHMLVQSLAAHAGFCELLPLSVWRVMRIAVLPQLQCRGIGQSLLAELEARARQQSVDCLGVAYALDARLLGFWRQAGFQTMRVGYRRDHASGSHSAQMLKPLTAATEQLVSLRAQRFAEQLPWRLFNELSDLDAECAQALVMHSAVMYSGDKPWNLSDFDTQDVHAFAFQQRSLADVQPALSLWLLNVLRSRLGDVLASHETALCLQKILQRRDHESIARELGLQGEKSQVNALRDAVAKVLVQQQG